MSIAASAGLRAVPERAADGFATENTNTLLPALLEAIPEGVIAVDDSRRIVFANGLACKMFNIPSKRRPNESLMEIVGHPGLDAAVSAALAKDGMHTDEFETRSPRRVIAFRSQPAVTETGRVLVLVLDDITELRRLEIVRQDFFANISHDLKTPIAAIKAFTETLLDHADDASETRQRFLKRIEEQTERLHSLVQDMLMLARVESKEPGFVMQPFDVRDVVRASVANFRPDGELKGLKLSFELDKRACMVRADVEGMQVILRNLIDNAVKYTPTGGAIVVKVTHTGTQIAVAVSDTGIGIPKEHLARIFERFYRVDKARSRQVGGTGLGLSIVKHMAQTFGGAVTAESAQGTGTTITVALPVASGTPRPSVR